MKQHIWPIITSFSVVLLMVGCKDSKSPTSEEALAYIQQAPEFNTTFFAPINIGVEILTSPENANPQKYIAEKYDNLIKAKLIEVEVVKKNSWRTVIESSLTAQAKKLEDGRRATDEKKYVAACTLKPVRVVDVDTIAADSIVYNYEFAETQITPFGKFLGFSDQKTHNAKAIAVRKDKKWQFTPLFVQ